MLRTLAKHWLLFFTVFIGVAGLAWTCTLPNNEGIVYVYDREPLSRGQNLVFYNVTYGGNATVTYPLYLSVTPYVEPLAKQAVPGPSPFDEPILVIKHGYDIEYELQGNTLTIYYPFGATVYERKDDYVGYKIRYKTVSSNTGFINNDFARAENDLLRLHKR